MGYLKIDGTVVVVNVTFKTRKPRYIRLVMAKEHLIKWKSGYPEEITEDALVFLNERRQPMTHQQSPGSSVVSANGPGSPSISPPYLQTLPDNPLDSAGCE